MLKPSRGKATRKTLPAPKPRSNRPKRNADRTALDMSPLIIDQTEGGGVLPKAPSPKRDSALRAARARWDYKRTR